MKRALLLAMLLVTGASHAEVVGNPDRVPSVGFSYGGLKESGNAALIFAADKAEQSLEIRSNAAVVDVRVPVTRSLTLSASYGFTRGYRETPLTPRLNAQQVNTDGNSFSVSVRFYIQD